MPDRAAAVERILFVTLSCVGDAVMTTPVLQALHDRYPGARIDVVADRRSSLLFRHCPYLGEVVHKDKQRFLRGAVSLIRALRRRRYDLIVDLRTDGLAWLFRGRRRLTKWHGRAYGPHSVERMMGVIRAVHGTRPIPDCRLWVSPSEEREAEARLAALPAGGWLALGPGSAGGRAQKAWPADRYAALANALADRFTGVVIAGGPNDRDRAGALAAGLTLPHIDLTDSNLLQAAAVLARAGYYIGSDSGLGHVAAAMSVPTLTLFSVDTPERCRPWGGRATWVQGAGGFVRDIPVAEVEAAARAALDSGSPRG